MFELKKIGIIKRLSALLLDAVLLAVLTTGFMCLIGLICKFDKQQDKLTEYGEKWNDYCLTYYGEIADYYGYTFEVGSESIGQRYIKRGDYACTAQSFCGEKVLHFLFLRNSAEKKDGRKTVLASVISVGFFKKMC